MVYGADMIGHQLGLRQVGGSLQTHGEGVETGPVGFRAGIVLDTHLGVFLGDGRDHRGVETAA